MGGLFLGRNSPRLQLLLFELLCLTTLFVLVRIKDVVLVVIALVWRLVLPDLVLLPWEVVHVHMAARASHHYSKHQHEKKLWEVLTYFHCRHESHVFEYQIDAERSPPFDRLHPT